MQRNFSRIVFTLFFSFFFLSFIEVNAEEFVPPWLKNNALWWGEEKISDNEFIYTLQFLLENEIIRLSEGLSQEVSQCGPGTVFDEFLDECIIPEEFETKEIFLESKKKHQSVMVSWIKDTTLWWGQGKISNEDFIYALEFLVENNVLVIPQPDEEKPTLPEPLSGVELLKNYPTYTSSWTPIESLQGFQVHGHYISQEYLLRFQLYSIDGKEISSDGTISVSIIDANNRILFLDTFSVKKKDFSKVVETFTGNELLVYSWEIPTSQVKKGFGDLGIAKVVFTDKAGNSFSGEFSSVSIPKFG